MFQAMSGNLDQFLMSLKRFNGAGVINTLGVIATFAVAFVALAPSIWKWIRRPRLLLQLKSRSHDAVIRVCDEAGNVTEAHNRQTLAESESLL